MNIINRQLSKMQKHYEALKEYKEFVDKVVFNFTRKYDDLILYETASDFFKKEIDKGVKL